jgi:phosphate-selective porin OprO/OprP
MKKISLATTAVALTLAAGTAWGADKPASSTERQIQMLQEQLRAMQEQLDALKATNAAQGEAIARETEAREADIKAAREANLESGGRNVFEGGRVRMIPPANPRLTQNNAAFTLSSPDGRWTMTPTGRVHFDMGAYLNQKAEGTTGPGTAAGGKLSNGVNLRRARFGVTGRANGDFTYSLVFDGGGTNDGVPTGASGVLINQAIIGYTGIRNTIIDAGYQAQFVTLDESNSSNNIMFLERATPATLASSFAGGDPRFGMGFRTWESNWYFAAYLSASQPGVAHALQNRGWSAYQRLTYNPIQNDLQSVHIGVNAIQLLQVPTGAPNTTTAPSISFSDRPELRIDTTQLLNTGALGTVANPVTGAQIYGVEAAAAFGSFYTQAEVFKFIVNRRGKTDAAFEAAYAQASYIFGGRRTYSANCGCYSGVNPITNFSPKDSGMGAFEIAARFSYANLTDQFIKSTTNAIGAAGMNLNAVNGGQQTNMTVGLNWFWNPNMLWKLNYIHSNYDRTNIGGTKSGVAVDALAARFQFMF